MRVLPSPISTFRGLRDRPAVLAPWLVVSLATVVLTLFTLSITQRASVHMLAGVDDPALVRSVEAQLNGMKWVSVVLSPVQVMARWMVTAVLFWALGTFALGGVPFRRALSIAAFAGLPLALGSGVDLAVTWFQGPEFTPGMIPVMTPASSVAALFPSLDQPAYVASLVRNVTAFSLWGAALWIVGLRETLETSWARAGFVGAAVWCVFLLSTSAADAVRTSLVQMSAFGGG
ncbi:YIP1 family protein [bacterium]|nr:YIP1 family protein [bacterium]